MANADDYKIIYKIQPCPNRIEVRFNAVNTKTGSVFNDVVPYPLKSELDEKQILAGILVKLDRCEAALLERDVIDEPTQPVTAKQVEAYLKTEGIITETQTLASIKTEMAKVG